MELSETRHQNAPHGPAHVTLRLAVSSCRAFVWSERASESVGDWCLPGQLGEVEGHLFRGTHLPGVIFGFHSNGESPEGPSQQVWGCG